MQDLQKIYLLCELPSVIARHSNTANLTWRAFRRSASSRICYELKSVAEQHKKVLLDHLFKNIIYHINSKLLNCLSVL